ncbi:helix-hairpin-helix domain-containing protein [Microbacterium sp. QXD-8]|uniref:Helix-hairpin-helix domain-containing protein n=1 Tax=Microbacterium psychrotolerans TaxID=3068321 RepID=A0ABU0YWY9_9MICO|nr:helix-hairpin-helix domain-containing protein [Microbacterium sp. QXD-8]MDQ7876833.1 helix-hairpin-helix domain-containing protein [Microbacterium sp. QXD-8]
MSSTTRAKVQADAPSIGWMLGMSSWMLLTVIPGPIVTWLGFSIIGVVSRSRRLIVLGVVWGAAAILVSLEIWGQWQPLVRAIVYLSGMLVALMVNPGWLRTMWQRRLDRAEQAGAASFGRVASRSPGTASSTGSSTGATKKPSTRSSRRARAAAARAAAAKAAAARAAEAEAEAAAEADSASKTASDDTVELASAVGASSDDLIVAREKAVAPAEPVDVNTATAAELEDLPGMSRSRARRAVKEREAQGGFTSVEDFGETVGLQPHEIVRLRRVATCSPRPRGERRFGRRVDY